MRSRLGRVVRSWGPRNPASSPSLLSTTQSGLSADWRTHRLQAGGGSSWLSSASSNPIPRVTRSNAATHCVSRAEECHSRTRRTLVRLQRTAQSAGQHGSRHGEPHFSASSTQIAPTSAPDSPQPEDTLSAALPNMCELGALSSTQFTTLQSRVIKLSSKK